MPIDVLSEANRAVLWHHIMTRSSPPEADRIRWLLTGIATGRLASLLDDVQRTPTLVIVRDSSGAIVYRSQALMAGEAGLGHEEARAHATARGATTPQFFSASLESWGLVRFICVPLSNGQGLYLQVGQPLGDVGETLALVVTASLLLIPAVLALTSVGGLAIARRALAPMDRMRITLEAIEAQDLSRRIDVGAKEAEVGRLADAVNRLLDRLERAFASLRKFAGDASHQLQTPLTVMKGSVDVALSAPRDAQAYRDVLEEVGQEADTMTAILADLRAFSLADAGLRAAGDAPLDLSAALAEAADIIAALGESAGINVDVSIEPGLFVRGDAVRLQQVVFNLGENAVKYSLPGMRVALVLAREGEDAVLRVSDAGPGIAEQDLPHIFDRFYRARRAGQRTEGSGLGLAIARRIVEAHGGRITVQSRPGAGACFAVHLALSPGPDVRSLLEAPRILA